MLASNPTTYIGQNPTDMARKRKTKAKIKKEKPLVPVYDIMEVRNCLDIGWTNWDDIRHSAYCEWAIRDYFKHK